MSPARAVVALLLAISPVLPVLPVLPASPAAAATPRAGAPGFCPDGDGVTVVVDFRALGGEQVVRCAPGPQEDGVDALRGAGFEVEGTNRWGDSFVCRINGRPGPDAEPCVDTPPASAYWSYWHAPDGGAWEYSQYGATYRTPPEGSFEGWVFSTNDGEGEASPPGVAPERPGDGGSSGSGSGGAGDGSSGGGNSSGGGSGDGGADGEGSADGGASAGGTQSGGSGGADEAGSDGPGGAGGAGDSDGSADTGSPDDEHQDEGEDRSDAPADGAGPGQGDASDDASAPSPTEASDWSGEDTEFEERRSAAAEDSAGPPASTLVALGLLVALVGTAGLAVWRRRRARGAEHP
ncbi:hypothetical protein [Streptomyces sp. B6B3]|uniref:hypothetical protein n=1 Tax=Streptomyces sp. B6B3 TaxID=3153570 RepID=UPI00325C9957